MNIYIFFFVFIKMQNLNSTMKEWQVYHGMIDTATYVVGNYVMNMIAGTPKPHVSDTVAFVVSDYFIRMSPTFLDPVQNKLPFGPEGQKNQMIAITSFITSCVIDGLNGGLTKNEILKNLIRNSIALGGNAIIDNLIDPNYT